MKHYLTNEQLDHFVTYGYVRVQSLFSSIVASQCRNIVWNDLAEISQISKEDRSTWVNKFQLSKSYPVKSETDENWSCISFEKLTDIANQLCGENSVNMDHFRYGWWSLSFPGFCEPPNDIDGHWHIEGHNFQHYCDSAEIGCFLIMLFNDVLPNGVGGATLMIPGSHLVALEHLVESGMRGMSSNELASVLLDDFHRFGSFTEAYGNAGDVYFCHRLLLHGRGKHLGDCCQDNVRFMCHPNFPLKTCLNLAIPSPLQECVSIVLSRKQWSLDDVSVCESRDKLKLELLEEEDEEGEGRKRKVEEVDCIYEMMGFHSFK